MCLSTAVTLIDIGFRSLLLLEGELTYTTQLIVRWIHIVGGSHMALQGEVLSLLLVLGLLIEI